MRDSFEQSQGDRPVTIHLEYVPFVNFAMQQNAVPLLKSLTVKNKTTAPLDHVEVRIWSDPPVLAEKTVRMETLGSGSEYTFKELALTLLREPLRKQTERENGHFWIEVKSDNEPPVRRPFPLTLLAYNEWHGTSTLSEIIAAHVLPNDPAVERILAVASEILQEKTQDGSISGYQDSDPGRAFTLAAAIYWAATREKIKYVSPPASFENTGQKIRTPEHLLDRRLGTCMDTTTLLAACFEQAGLRPVVIFVEGHAFPGVWIVDKSFDEPVTPHASLLLNRISLGEFLVVESTAITKDPPPQFETARHQARLHLQKESRFLHAVDIRAARTIGIRPLPMSATHTEHTDTLCPADPFEQTPVEDLNPQETYSPSISTGSAKNQKAQETGADRLERWKLSLLDLSLRNRLLNFKESKKTIPLLCPDIATVENALAAGNAFRVRPKPEAWGASDPRDQALHLEQRGTEALGEYLLEEMGQERLHASLTEHEVAVRLIHIERAAVSGWKRTVRTRCSSASVSWCGPRPSRATSNVVRRSCWFR